ncbi:MAG: ABC transporter ATP-binding protein [Alphaproteobacteria bacterium]|nr:MAG: ABC transporter ATP-binding protein [Alphaproteobacteria bacterium]
MTAGAGARPVVLRVAEVTRRFGDLLANDAITFDLHQGEVVALLGENGAGKTTLMNILFGHYTADAGTVEVFGRPLPPGQPRAALEAGVGMVHQHFTLAENLTVLENIVLGTESLWRPLARQAAARARVERLSRDFGLAVHPDARVGALSVGERQRVEILKALYRDARILILDEPTAVLTPQEAEALFATLRAMVAQGLSVIFISHKMHEVLAISNRVLVLRHGRLVGERATAETGAQELARLMVGADIALPEPRAHSPGAVLLRLSGVKTEPRGRTAGLRGLDLALRAGQITGLAGVSGNGQAALAAVIAGLDAPVEGTLEIAGQVPAAWSPRAAIHAGIGRIPEDRHAEGTIADFTLTENAMLERMAEPPFARAGLIDWAAARRFAERVIADYDVRCPGPDAPIRLLSGGNMQKLILGRALEFGPRIILANQPVRGLDIGAVAYVQRRLIAARDAGAAILLISEDLDEIQAMSDVIHVISEGRLSPPFARGEKTAHELGQWMAGHGFEGADAA